MSAYVMIIAFILNDSVQFASCIYQAFFFIKKCVCSLLFHTEKSIYDLFCQITIFFRLVWNQTQFCVRIQIHLKMFKYNRIWFNLYKIISWFLLQLFLDSNGSISFVHERTDSTVRISSFRINHLSLCILNNFHTWMYSLSKSYFCFSRNASYCVWLQFLNQTEIWSTKLPNVTLKYVVYIWQETEIRFTE